MTHSETFKLGQQIMNIQPLYSFPVRCEYKPRQYSSSLQDKPTLAIHTVDMDKGDTPHITHHLYRTSQHLQYTL